MGEGEHVERPPELALDYGIEEANPLHVGELDASHAFGAPHVEHLGFDDAVLAGGLPLLFQADDGAGQRAWLGGARLLHDHLDFFAAGLLHDLAESRIARQVDGEALQGPLDRIVALVADRTDVAFAQILQHHAFQEVVDVLDREGQVDAGVAVDLAFALEIADAAAEEDHLANRQLHGGLDGAGVGGSLTGFGRRGRLENEQHGQDNGRHGGQSGP